MVIAIHRRPVEIAFKLGVVSDGQAIEQPIVEPHTVLRAKQTTRGDQARDRHACGRAGRREAIDGHAVNVVVGIVQGGTWRDKSHQAAVIVVSTDR